MDKIATTILVTGFLIEALALGVDVLSWKNIKNDYFGISYTISRRARKISKTFAVIGLLVIITSFYFYIWS
jgi:hypothetical protein